MAKQKHPEAPKGQGQKFIGNIGDLPGRMIEDKKQLQAAVEELSDGGPAHKQILTALLLSRVESLVDTIEKTHNISFRQSKGFDLIKEEHGEEKKLPVQLPVMIDKSKADKEKIAEAAAKAPGHEALAYSIAIQGIEWSLSVLAKGNEN